MRCLPRRLRLEGAGTHRTHTSTPRASHPPPEIPFRCLIWAFLLHASFRIHTDLPRAWHSSRATHHVSIPQNPRSAFSRVRHCNAATPLAHTSLRSSRPLLCSRRPHSPAPARPPARPPPPLRLAGRLPIASCCGCGVVAWPACHHAVAPGRVPPPPSQPPPGPTVFQLIPVVPSCPAQQPGPVRCHCRPRRRTYAGHHTR